MKENGIRVSQAHGKKKGREKEETANRKQEKHTKEINID